MPAPDPAPVWPVMRYTDAPAALAFLVDVLGFTQALVVPGEAADAIAHAELAWPGGGGVLLGTRDPDQPTHLPPGGSSVYTATDDPDALFERVVAAGAAVVQGLLDEAHGRGFTVADTEGNLWSFGTHHAALPSAAGAAAGIRRLMPHFASARFDDSRAFYVGFLGLVEVMDYGYIVTFASPTNPTAQVSVVRDDPSGAPRGHLTVEVDDVDAAHAEAERLGLRVLYPLTDEPWGVRRFFVAAPDDVVVNVMTHP